MVLKQNQSKILLVQPPYYRLFKKTYSSARYPLSLGYLAGEIRRKTNWNVLVYDSDFQTPSEVVKVSYLSGAGFDSYRSNLLDLSGDIWEEIRLAIAEYKPTVVGISAHSHGLASALLVANLVKEINKHTIVIVGGAYPSTVGADLLNNLDIDICVKGEGENTIIELLDAIDNQKALHIIQGIVYRKDGQIVTTTPREFINDLDSLCFPHEYAPEVLKDYSQYPITAFNSIFATRGCPNNCFFCGSRNLWSRKVRFRSPENVVQEIKGLQKMGLKIIHFDDDTFGVNRKYINELCNELILHCPGLRWSCQIHPSLVDEQNISLMKAAGCLLIKMGIESGNNEILSAMRKNITIEQALDACRLIKKHGIELRVYFMVGFPQETEETLMDTIFAMKKAKSDAIIYSIFTPYPGTEAFEFCVEKGLVGDNYDGSLYNHQSPANNFCLYLTQERFRELVSRMEKSIDRKNWLFRIRNIFSLKTIIKIQESGISGSIKSGLRFLIRK